MSDRRRQREEHCWEEVLNGEVTPRRLAHLVACHHCAEMIRGVVRSVEAVDDRLPPLRGELDERVLAALDAEARGRPTVSGGR